VGRQAPSLSSESNGKRNFFRCPAKERNHQFGRNRIFSDLHGWQALALACVSVGSRFGAGVHSVLKLDQQSL
jgi:hypothetical protein